MKIDLKNNVRWKIGIKLCKHFILIYTVLVFLFQTTTNAMTSLNSKHDSDNTKIQSNNVDTKKQKEPDNTDTDNFCKSVLNTPEKIYNEKSLKSLYNIFKILDRSWTKSEFETTKQFKIREQDEKNKLQEKIKQRLNSDFVSYTFSPKTTYDADTETFTVYFGYTDFLKKIHVGSSILDDTITDSGAIGQNAFGATVDIKDRDLKLIWINVNNWQYGKKKEIKIKLNQARDLKENLMVLMISDITKINISSNTYYERATFNNPYNMTYYTIDITLFPTKICFYNKKTKEIYKF